MNVITETAESDHNDDPMLNYIKPVGMSEVMVHRQNYIRREVFNYLKFKVPKISSKSQLT